MGSSPPRLEILHVWVRLMCRRPSHKPNLTRRMETKDAFGVLGIAPPERFLLLPETDVEAAAGRLACSAPSAASDPREDAMSLLA